MKKYKLYVDIMKGYEYIDSFTFEQIIGIMDTYILKRDNIQKLLVIEHDYEQNCDFPFYCYTGFDKEYYLQFREQFISQEKDIDILKK